MQSYLKLFLFFFMWLFFFKKNKHIDTSLISCFCVHVYARVCVFYGFFWLFFPPTEPESCNELFRYIITSKSLIMWRALFQLITD